MTTRLDLHSALCKIMGCPETGSECRVYFQPPISLVLKYPCIVYAVNTGDTQFADDNPYIYERRYQVTLIDTNPDTAYHLPIAMLQKCLFDRRYTADNLYHDVFNIYV